MPKEMSQWIMILRLLKIIFALLSINLIISKGSFEVCSANQTKHRNDLSRNVRFSREPDQQREPFLNANGSCEALCPIGLTGCRCNISCASSPIGCPFGCDRYGVCKNCKHCSGGLQTCVGKQNIYGHWVYRCMNGCLEGWFGNKCDKTCSEISEVENCTKCQQVSLTYFECTECTAGLYLTDRSTEYQQIPDMTSGLTGSHVFVIEVGNRQKCIPCNPGCQSCGTEVACESDTGNCRFGCKDRYEGNKCDKFCRNQKCSQCKPHSTEECLHCETGWSGKYCTETCHKNCINNTCNSATGECTLGCVSGWTGHYCNLTCCQFCYERKQNECVSCIQNFGEGYCYAIIGNGTKLSKTTIYTRLPMVTIATISTGVTLFLIMLGVIYIINRKRSKSLHRPLVADKRQKVLQNTYIDFGLKEYFI